MASVNICSDFGVQENKEFLFLIPTTQETTLHMDITRWVNTEIRLMIFFAEEDGEALYNQQKQDLELTMAQIMNSLLQNSYFK